MGACRICRHPVLGARVCSGCSRLARPGLVTRTYGTWRIASETDDVLSEVLDAIEAGATCITVEAERVVNEWRAASA